MSRSALRAFVIAHVITPLGDPEHEGMRPAALQSSEHVRRSNRDDTFFGDHAT